MTEPLKALLRKEQEWVWGPPQRKAFQEVKDSLVSTEALCHYDPNRPTVIAADACKDSLGAVLLQMQHDGTDRPVRTADGPQATSTFAVFKGPIADATKDLAIQDAYDEVRSYSSACTEEGSDNC